MKKVLHRKHSAAPAGCILFILIIALLVGLAVILLAKTGINLF
jgi:hypothetical protein